MQASGISLTINPFSGFKPAFLPKGSVTQRFTGSVNRERPQGAPIVLRKDNEIRSKPFR